MDTKLDKFIKIIDYINIQYGHKKINKSQFIKDIYEINLLIYKLYKIYSSSESQKQKIQAITNLEMNGSRFISPKQATLIYNIYAPKIAKVYKKIYKLQKKSLYNKSDDVLYGGGQVRCINSLIDILINKLDNFDTLGMSNILFNWVFFPLWSIENLPIIGNVAEVPLDIMGNILDNIDIFADMISPILPVLVDIGFDVAQAIPGVGTAVSPVAIGFNFVQGPFEYFISDGPDLIGMFINISRKQWGLAYLSALAAIPNFAELVDSAVSGMHTVNKWLKRTNNSADNAIYIIDKINKNINTYTPIIQPVLTDPSMITDPLKIFNKLILPNKDKIPILKDLSPTDINYIEKNIGKIKPIIYELKKNPITYIKNPNKLIELIMKYKHLIPGINGVSIKGFEKKGVIYANKTLKYINKLLDNV